MTSRPIERKRNLKVAMVAPVSIHVQLFWSALAERLLEGGAEVHLYSVHDQTTEQLRRRGVVCKEVPISRFIAPGSDLRLLWRLYREFRRERYDIVHNFTIKANVFGAIAARAAGCQRIVNTVLGLGYAFSPARTASASMLNHTAAALYRLGFGACTKAGLINNDDIEEVLRRGLISERKVVFIKGGQGVDLRRHSPAAVEKKELEDLKRELTIAPGAPVVLMASRLFWGKGVREFCEAAAQVKHEVPEAVFLLAGPLDRDNPDAVPESYLRQVARHVQWLGARNDMRPLMALCDVFVLPSFYREGMPQVLIEAASFGKPVVTTDNVGCRQTVEHGWNGFMVPVRNVDALSGAIMTLLTDHPLRVRCGENSRRKAERDYDKEMVVDQIVQKLYELGA